jgi:hypothetical protein
MAGSVAVTAANRAAVIADPEERRKDDMFLLPQEISLSSSISVSRTYLYFSCCISTLTQDDSSAYGRYFKVANRKPLLWENEFENAGTLKGQESNDVLSWELEFQLVNIVLEYGSALT